MKLFITLAEACGYIQDKKLAGYVAVLSPDFGGWIVTNGDSDVEYTINAMTAETGLIPDPHYGANSNHTPLTPDSNCPECIRLGWVTVPITVEFVSVAGAA